MKKNYNKSRKYLLLTHFNFDKRGSIHGPVHSVVSYLRKKKINYKLVSHPLYNGAKSETEIFDDEGVRVKKWGPLIPLPLIIKSTYEIVSSIVIGLTGKQKKIIAIDPLNALSAIIIKKFGKCDNVAYYTVDYAEDRFEERIFNKIYHLVDGFVIKNSDQVWSVSKRILDKRREQGVEESKNLYVPNSPLYFSVKRLPISKVNRNNIVMVVGKTHSNVLPEVLEAFKKVRKKFSSAKLLLVGPLKSTVREYGKNVEVLGQLPHKKLINILKASGIGLAIYTNDYPWTHFGDSMKAREYLLCGLPVVISNVVSTADDIKINNAGVVVKVSERDISKAITKILRDKKFWLKLRKNAVNLAKKFDFEKILDKVLKE